MKNYVSSGEILTVPAPWDVKSGDIVAVRNIVGTAMADATAGNSVDILTEGVFGIYAENQEFEIGDLVYFNTITRLKTNLPLRNTFTGGTAFHDYPAGITLYLDGEELGVTGEDFTSGNLVYRDEVTGLLTPDHGYNPCIGIITS